MSMRCSSQRMPATHHVYLIPGFFGFVNFGKLVYFTHVRELLEEAFGARRFPVEIHRARLRPTSSLRVRAAELVKMIQETAPPGAPVHLIGHSTGGLDARLITSPGVTLEGVDTEACAARVRTVISVATPHRGTPLAAFFSSMMGQQALRLLSLATITVLRRGRFPIALLARTGAGLTRAFVRGRRGRTGQQTALLEHLEAELLGTISAEQRDLVGTFLRDVHGDQALIPQIAPPAMEVFDAATQDRPGVRYACVTAEAARPRLGARLGLGLSPWAQSTYTFYTWLHRQVGPGDGIVPIHSQRRGEILYEAKGDHLDVIGHFDDPSHQPPHQDWIYTGSGFARSHFEALWNKVAAFVAQSER